MDRIRTIVCCLIVAAMPAVAAANGLLCAEDTGGRGRAAERSVNRADANETPKARALRGTWVGRLRRDGRSVRIVLFVKPGGEASGVLGRYDAPVSASLTSDDEGGGRSLSLRLDEQSQFVSAPMTLASLLAVRGGKRAVRLVRTNVDSSTEKATVQLKRTSHDEDLLALIPDSYDVSQLTVKGTADDPLTWLAVCRELGAARPALEKAVTAAMDARAKIAALNRKLGPHRRSMSVYMRYLRLLESIRKQFLAELGETMNDARADGLEEIVGAVTAFEDDAAVLIAAMKVADDDPDRRKRAARAYEAFVARRTAAVRKAVKVVATKAAKADAETEGDDDLSDEASVSSSPEDSSAQKTGDATP